MGSEPPELETLAVGLTLHTGEREALRLSLHFESAIFLTDDTAARLAADSLGIVAHGTIGVLVRAIRRHQRTKVEVLSILESLPVRSTLHLKRSLLNAVIAEVRAS